GRVGAVIRQGRSFITSPNTSYIREPPLGGDRSVFLRSDFRYGDDDPLQWPQPLARPLLFLSTIPEISDDNHPLAIMSYDLSQSDFAEDQNGLLSGIGKIKNIQHARLSALSSDLLARVQNFMQSVPPAATAGLIEEYSDLLRRYLYRLEHVTTDFSNTQFTFRGLQRVYLYLYALLDWEEVFCPRLLSNKEGAGVAVSQVVGAFTTDPELGDSLYRMGIPVWLIRPYKDLVNAHVHDLTSLKPPSTELILTPSRYKAFSIFKGQNDGPLIYGAIMYQLHIHTRYPSPFGQDVAPTNVLAPPLLSSSRSPLSSPLSSPFSSPSTSTSSLSSRSSTPTGRAPSQKSQSSRHTPFSNRKPKNPQPGDKGRDKFAEPNTLTGYLPPALPIWAAALRNINQYNMSSFSAENDGVDLSYVFPEPVGFVTVQNTDRRRSMIDTWLRFRPALLYRLTNATSNATSMPARVWKNFLSIDFLESDPNKKSKDNTGTSGISKSAKTLAYAKDFYQSLLNEDGVVVLDSSHSSSPVVPWRGKPFDTLVESDFREIFWEINELNFRFEFMALDSRLSTDADKPFHQDDVNECFPASTGSLLVVDVAKANSGMASALLDQRGRALLAIRTLMQNWRGSPPPLITSTHPIAWNQVNNLDHLEVEIAKFYTQSFFNTFHRAPVIPRWLPHLPQTTLPSPFRHKMVYPRPNIYYDLRILDNAA
ncbi:hypothetical protein BDN72DRAFT_778742, partial [Pluteus cervinus]